MISLHPEAAVLPDGAIIFEYNRVVVAYDTDFHSVQIAIMPDFHAVFAALYILGEFAIPPPESLDF
jgi:hypothetical protein